MAGKSRDFQPGEMRPGVMLHQAIIGAFRAKGDTFSNWCNRHGIAHAYGRNATFGVSRGPEGTALLNRIIDAAGRDMVEAAFWNRIESHVAEYGEARK